MARIAVLGAGPAGLACGYHLLRAGHEVTIYEADDRAGGMSAHFDFDGLDIERFYHFVCTPDEPLFELLRELDIYHELEWRVGTMGYFYKGELFDWGNPIALLRFPHLSLLSKIRYGLHTYLSTRIRHWPGLEDENALRWVKRWVGEEAWNVLWWPLFELKFYQYADNLSAEWIRSRIRRLGRSRKSILQEKLGYLRGGSQTLISRLVEVIEAAGGEIRLGRPVEEVVLGKDRVVAIRSAGELEPHDCVASTVPIPLIPKVIPGLPEGLKAQYAKLDNIGAVCVLFKLARPLTKYFWLNTADHEMAIPGVIEFSNLRPLDDAIVSVPYYLPQDHPRFNASDDELIEESFGYLQRINPEIAKQDVKAVNVSRIRYAQPICQPGFSRMLPKIETEIRGLYVADTSYYYPEDRSISESVNLGRKMAGSIRRSLESESWAGLSPVRAAEERARRGRS